MTIVETIAAELKKLPSDRLVRVAAALGEMTDVLDRYGEDGIIALAYLGALQSQGE